MDKFKASFRFYEKAAPYPGMCLRCGTSDKLWQLGEIRGTTMAAYYCDGCLTELAMFTGMVTGKSYAELSATKQTKIDELQAQVDAAPKLLKELSNNVNGILSDFAIALADVASSAVSSNSKASEANPPFATADDGATAEAGQGKKPSAKSGSESSGK